MSWDIICGKKSNEGMWFRKLHDFNLALLGNQAWRFITKPELLAFKIFKARYFPNYSFMEASISSNPSYA